MCRFSNEALLDMIHHSPMSAVKMVRRIIRHQCYEYIYQHKLEQKQQFEFFHIQDEDLFIDLKLNYQNDHEREIQAMFSKTNKEPLAAIQKGREFETRPFFLSDEFKTILDDKVKGTNGGGPSDNTESNLGGMMDGSGSGGGNLYKSGFLKEKIIEQNEKRKRERKSKKNGQDSEKTAEQTPLGGAKAAKKRGGAKDADDGMLGEEV